MAYQINLTGQEIDERLQNVGTPADNPDANGTLFARLNKNVDDVDALNDSVGHIQDEQAATDKTVTQHTADISALQTAVGDVKKDVEKNATAIGNADDPNDAKGSLYARVNKANASTSVNRLAITTLSSANKKNQTDITDIGSRQTNIEKVVSVERSNVFFSLPHLLLNFRNYNPSGVYVTLYRWTGKRYHEFEIQRDTGGSFLEVAESYKITLENYGNDGLSYQLAITYADGTKELLVGALKNAFGGRISHGRRKKRRWRLQAFLSGRPITAPFDFRVSIGHDGRVSLTKEGMMRSVPKAKEVVYDGNFNGELWLAHKKGEQFNIVFFEGEETIKRFPMPGDPVSSTGETYGAVVAVKEKPTATAITYNILWTNGVALYEIGVLEEAGVLSYTCTSPAKKLCNDIYDYASKMSSGTLRDLYISAGAKYNEATGFYELNGLTDITEEEMRRMYLLYITNSSHAQHLVSWLSDSLDVRTNIVPYVYYAINMQNSIGDNKNLEVLALSKSSLYISGSAAVAHGSFPKLRKVLGNWVYNSENPSRFDFYYGQPFEKCPLLEEIRMKGINKSHTFAVSPNLSKESVQYMIENANPPSGAAVGSITITLHPTAYTRLKDDADIVAALEAKGGIVTLVSA